ncbi:MAG: CU044_2847 family protein [Cyanobacteria bacterium P01_H01_bin.119]
MTQLAPITLEDGTIIYMEATEDLSAPVPATAETDPEDEPEGPTRRSLGSEKGLSEWMNNRVSSNLGNVQDSFQAVQGTIRAYTRNTLNAFKGLTDVTVDKVTLEFGVKVAGGAGVPYVTQGTAECNLKITVECSFPTEP